VNRLIVLSTLFGLVLTGCVEPPEIDSDSAEIVNGSPTSAYPEVGFITSVVDGEGAACSGTLISRRVVLTAAHCFDGNVTSQSVYFGTTIKGTDSGRIETIDTVDRIIYPNWSLSYGDVAMVLLAKEAQTEPVDINRSPLGNGDIGTTIDIVGWGDTIGDAGDAGDKRHVQATLDGFHNSYVYAYGDSSANTCQGDSGGPGFMDLGSGRAVAGITSWGRGGCLGESGATRVARFADWIDNWVAQKDQVLPPEVTITRPAANATVPGFFIVEADAIDNVGVTRVELWLNGQLSRTLQTGPFIFNAELDDGPATVEIRAYDTLDDVGTATINVNVDSSCTTDDDCPQGQFCADDGTCTPSNGMTGDDCIDNADCASGICGMTGDGSFCTELCQLDPDTCPDGYECVNAGPNTNACVRSSGGSADGDGGGGCSTGSGAPAALWLVGLALIGLVRRRSV
jgi:MYXO-CTERM domain-containing protein